MRTFLTHNGNPMGWKLKDLKKEASKYLAAKIEVSEYSEAEEISYQMIKWWKGVLLPAIAKFTGDTVLWWETTLKMNVMPEYFKPEVVVVKIGTAKVPFNVPRSIANMPMKRAIELVDGSVEWLHSEEHKGLFLWVTLPDPELRK